MSKPYQDLMNAVALARRAIRRGDVEAAERWLRVAERADKVSGLVLHRLKQLDIARRLAKSS